MRFPSFLVVLALAPLLCAASEPVRLAPASKWVLDYGENSCRLIRTFGDPAKPTVLVFERVSPKSQLSMVAIGKSLKPSIGAEDVAARFLPVDNLKFDHGRIAKSAAEKEPAILWSSISFTPTIELDGEPTEELKKEMKRAMLAYERGERPEARDLSKIVEWRAEQDANAAKVTSIEIAAKRGHPVILETGSLGRAIKMLGECSRHQMRGWGLDPAVEDKIVRPVWTPSQGGWLTTDDYPKSALWQLKESVVEARLLVDASGKVAKCTSLSHGDTPLFGKVVCDALSKRAKFSPAELADGTKVPSYYTVSTRFVITD